MMDGSTRDPTQVAAQFTPATFAATVVPSGIVVAFSFTATGRAWLGVAPRVVAAFATVHAVLFAFNVWIIGGTRLSSPRAWRLLWLADAVTMAYTASYAATAANPLTPLWSFALACAALFGTRASRRVPHVVMVTLFPPLLRLWFSTDGLLIAACVGLVSGLSFVSVSHSVEAAWSERRRARSQIVLGEHARQRVAELIAAMSLHDGLSGLLFVVRHRARAADSEQREADVRLVRRRVEALLSSLALPVAADDVAQTLERMGRELGASVTVSGAPREVPDAIADVLLIAHELLANAARHGLGGAHLEVRLARTEVSLRCRSRTRVSAFAEGRGLRNLRLRAESHGGRARFAVEGDQFEADVRWPDQDPDLHLARRGLATTFPAFVALVLAGLSRKPFAAIPAGVTVLMLVAHFRAERAERAERRAAAQLRLRLERTPRLATLERALRTSLVRLVAVDPEAACDALDDMAASLADSLRSLEEPDDQSLLQSQLSPTFAHK